MRMIIISAVNERFVCGAMATLRLLTFALLMVVCALALRGIAAADAPEDAAIAATR